MNEKELAVALEPLVDVLAETQKRLASLERQPGPSGKDADPNAVAAALAASPEFIASVKGKDADPVDPARVVFELVGKLKADPAFVDACKAPAPALDELIDRLVELHAEQLRGKPGEPGQPGEAPTAADVALAILLDPDKAEALRGEDGQDGKDGEKGADGLGAEVPQWEPGIYREGATVQAHLGQFYRAEVDTVAIPGESRDWRRLGTCGLRWRGLKPEADSLALGDLYIDGGSLFGVLSEKGPSMLLQRAKPTPALKGLRLKGNELSAQLSSGESLSVTLPDVEALAKSLDDTRIQLGEAMKTIAALRHEVRELRGAIEVEE